MDKEGKVVPTIVKAGDRVLLPGWGGNSIKVGDEVRSVFFFLAFGRFTDAVWAVQEYFLFRDSEILAKIQE